MKKRFIIFYVATFCIVAGLSFAMPASSAILFYEDFEDALALDPPKDWAIDAHGSGYQSLTTEQIRAGLQAYKFSATNTSAGYVRQELVMRAPFDPGSGSICFTIGAEYWIGFSVFLAEGYHSPASYCIIHQYHSVPDRPSTCDWTEGIRNAILSFKAKETNWVAWIQGSSMKCNPIPKVGVTGASYSGSQWVTGQWYDFVLNVKWSYESDGFLKIWENGVLVTDHTGGTCFNDDKGPYMKIGIYANLDQDQTVTIYYDELRIGDSNSSYLEVAPGVKPLPPILHSPEAIK